MPVQEHAAAQHTVWAFPIAATRLCMRPSPQPGHVSMAGKVQPAHCVLVVLRLASILYPWPQRLCADQDRIHSAHRRRCGPPLKPGEGPLGGLGDGHIAIAERRQVLVYVTDCQAQCGLVRRLVEQKVLDCGHPMLLAAPACLNICGGTAQSMRCGCASGRSSPHWRCRCRAGQPGETSNIWHKWWTCTILRWKLGMPTFHNICLAAGDYITWIQNLACFCTMSWQDTESTYNQLQICTGHIEAPHKYLMLHVQLQHNRQGL